MSAVIPGVAAATILYNEKVRKIITLLAFLFIFLYGFTPTRDPDFGWHYRCGKEIITKHQLCTANQFSYYLPNYHSYYPSFGYDFLLAVTYDRFGFFGVSFVNGLLFVLSAIILWRLFRGPVWLKTLIVFLILFLSDVVFGMGLRSQIVTFLFFILSIYILKKSADKPRLLYFLPFLFIVWANTHIGFFLGPVLYTLFVIDSLIKKRSVNWRLYFLSLAATLINPFGINAYLEIINHASSPLGTMIAEWVPPDIYVQILIAFTALAITSYMFFRRKFSVFAILSLIIFGYLAFTARRNLPLYYVTFFIILFEQFPVFSRLPELPEITLPILFSVTLFLTYIQIPKTLTFDNNWSNYCRSLGTNFPCQPIAKYKSLAGNIFASYEWGGFLIWKLPQAKVFIDGRMPAWKAEDGRSPYAVYLDILQTKPGWNEKLNMYKTDYIFMYPDTFIDVVLRPNPKIFGWDEVYRDDQAVIFKNLKQK